MKCTTKCSLGYKKRDVACIKLNKGGHILNGTLDKCNQLEKPTSQIICNMGECSDDYFWKPGKWSDVNIYLILFDI